MTSQQLNPYVQAQLASNAAMRQVHAQSQSRLDRIRAEAVVRTIARRALVQAAGIARNILAGQLPIVTAPTVRRQLAQQVGAFTVAKALRADAKARVLRS